MPNNNIINFLKKLIGFGIFIEAGILSLINFILFGLFGDNILNLIIPNHVKSVSEISAIFTIMLLSLGFIYFMGYFIAAKLWKVDINIGGGGTLSTHILPYGAIFLLAIFIPSLMIYLLIHHLCDLIFIIINFGFVFFVGFINEVIDQYLRYEKKKQRDKQLKENMEIIGI